MAEAAQATSHLTTTPHTPSPKTSSLPRSSRTSTLPVAAGRATWPRTIIRTMLVLHKTLTALLRSLSPRALFTMDVVAPRTLSLKRSATVEKSSAASPALQASKAFCPKSRAFSSPKSVVWWLRGGRYCSTRAAAPLSTARAAMR